MHTTHKMPYKCRSLDNVVLSTRHTNIISNRQHHIELGSNELSICYETMNWHVFTFNSHIQYLPRLVITCTNITTTFLVSTPNHITSVDCLSYWSSRLFAEYHSESQSLSQIFNGASVFARYATPLCKFNKEIWSFDNNLLV